MVNGWNSWQPRKCGPSWKAANKNCPGAGVKRPGQGCKPNFDNIPGRRAHLADNVWCGGQPVIRPDDAPQDEADGEQWRPEQGKIQPKHEQMGHRQNDGHGEQPMQPAPGRIRCPRGQRTAHARHQAKQRQPTQPPRPALLPGRQHRPGQRGLLGPAIKCQGKRMTQDDDVGRQTKPVVPAIHPFQSAKPLCQPWLPDHAQQVGQQQTATQPAGNDGDAAPDTETFRECPVNRHAHQQGSQQGKRHGAQHIVRPAVSAGAPAVSSDRRNRDDRQARRALFRWPWPPSADDVPAGRLGRPRSW